MDWQDKMSKFLILAAFGILGATLQAEEDNALWGWSISAGGNIGFGLKTDLKTSPVRAMQCLPSLTPRVGPTRQAAAAMTPKTGGSRVTYDAAKGYYVDPSSSWGETAGNESETWNWRLPDSAVVGQGADRHFEMTEEWGEVSSQSVETRNISDSDSAVTYGASVDLNHGLWMSEDASWGIDIAIGLTWMKAFDCFKAGGVAVQRSTTVTRGETTTSIPGEFFGSAYARAEDDGTWGNGTYGGDDPSRDQYLIDLDRITTSSRTLSTETYSDSMSISAQGDYEEWEISVLLKPWYDVNDWFCVHGLFGIGITRSSFEYSMDAVSGGATVYRSSQEFSEWRCYGLAGVGMLFRVWDFDLSCDGLFRWCQDDMSIRGKDVSGTIEKPFGTLRFGLSYAF